MVHGTIPVLGLFREKVSGMSVVMETGREKTGEADGVERELGICKTQLYDHRSGEVPATTDLQ